MTTSTRTAIDRTKSIQQACYGKKITVDVTSASGHWHYTRELSDVIWTITDLRTGEIVDDRVWSLADARGITYLADNPPAPSPAPVSFAIASGPGRAYGH